MNRQVEQGDFSNEITPVRADISMTNRTSAFALRR